MSTPPGFYASNSTFTTYGGSPLSAPSHHLLPRPISPPTPSLLSPLPPSPSPRLCAVLSAVSGLRVAVPALSQEVVVGVTVALLVGLFTAQQAGTGQVRTGRGRGGGCKYQPKLVGGGRNREMGVRR